MRPSFAQIPASLYVPLLCGSLLISGCASLPPPTAELDAAQQAVNRADAADAVATPAVDTQPVTNREHNPVVDATDMFDAVARATAMCVAGDAVVLSPACSSYDMFQNYGHRGRVFRDAVSAVGATRLDAGSAALDDHH